MMFPIQSVRLINLNIPDDNYDIAMTNDYYRFDSLDSLITLANGGGKSSLILLLSQVFKPNARRGNRRLKDYVPEQGYSVIAVELNQGQQFTTLNLVARKKFLIDLEGETTDSLEYFLFISEYDSNDCSGHNPLTLPFFKDKQYKQQTPYEELETIVKKKPEYFRHYKQNEVRKYMAYLEERFHNVAAWADTIWKINSAEGGASSLFSGSKTDADALISSQAVIRDHLIPIIESKNQINADEIEKQVATIARLYANQYENQLKRDRLNKVCEQIQHEFLEKTTDAQILTAKLNQAASAYEEATTPLNPLKKYHEQQLDALTAKQLELKKQFSETYILKQSNKVWLLKEEVEQLQGDICKGEMLVSDLKEKQCRTEHEIIIQEATQRFQEYVTAKEAVRLKQEAIEVKKMNNREKSLKITEIQQTLATAAHIKYQKVKSDLNGINHASEELGKELAEIEENYTFTYGEITKQEAQQDSLKEQLKGLKEAMAKKWESLSFDTKDITGNQQTLIDEQEELDCYLENCQEEIAKHEKSKEGAEEDLKHITSNYDKLEATIASREEELAQAKEKRKSYLIQLSKILSHAVAFNISDKDIQIHVNEKLAQWDREASALNKELYLIEQNLTAKRGVVVPNELEEWLSSNQITYVQGIDYLNERASKEEQANLIQSYPMLPYSLVLANPKDLERIKECPLQLDNDFLLTFMKDPDHYLGRPEVTWWGIGSYKVEALDPAFWEKRRQQLEEQAEDKKIQIEESKEKEINLHRIHSALDGYSIKSIERRETELERLLIKENGLNTKKHLQESILGEIEGLLLEYRQRKESTLERLQEIEEQLKILKSLAEDTEKQQVIFSQVEQIKSILIQKNNDLEKYRQLRKEGKNKRNYLIKQREEVSRAHFEVEGFFSKYEIYLPKIALEIEEFINLEELEQHLEQLQAEVDLTQLEEELARLNQSLTKAFDTFKELEIEEAICTNVTYSYATLKHLKGTLQSLREEYNLATNKLAANESILKIKQSQFEKEEEDLQEKISTHNQTYGEYKQAKTLTNDELREAQNFLRGALREIESELGKTTENDNQLRLAIQAQLKQKHFDMNNLRNEMNETQLAQIQVLDFLKELEDKQEKYEHQRDLLKDALNKWGKALKQAWNMSQEELNALPKGLRNQKESLMDLDMNNYLAVIEIHQTMIARLEEAIKNEEGKLKEADNQLQNFSEYLSIECQEVYDQLKLFDRGLNIEIQGKNQEILRLDVPLVCRPEQFESAIQEYVKLFVMDLSHLMQGEMTAKISETTEAKKTVENKIKNFRLGVILAQVIDFDRTTLKVLKVSNLDHNLILWENDNSGGQGSLKALILIFAIFKYLNNDKNGTTILLDNPFGKMSSYDLVDIMFKTAKRLKIKLICFTGIKEQHIQQQFKVHYKLSHVPTTTRGLARMRVERQGEERDVSRFERGYYSKEKVPSRRIIQESLNL